MRDLGWDVSIGDDGSIQAFVPNGQEEAYEDAQTQCWSQFTVRAFEDLNDSEKKDTYNKQVAVRNCLAEQGEDMPPAPSFQEYIEGDGSWSPYLDIPMEELISRDDALLKACRQVTW